MYTNSQILKALMKVKESESESCSVVSDSLWPHGLYSPWNFPGQNTGVGSHSLLQGIFPTQESNPGLPHCRRVFYRLSHQGSPRILCIAFAYHGQISGVWVMWAALKCSTGLYGWNSFQAVYLHLPIHQSEQSYPQTSYYRPLAGNLRIDHTPQVQRKQFKK